MELHLNLKGLWKWGDWWHAIIMIHLCFTESKSSTINTLLHLISLFQVSWFMYILWNQFNTRSVLVVDLNQNIKMNRFQCTSNKLKIDHNFGFMLKISTFASPHCQIMYWHWNIKCRLRRAKSPVSYQLSSILWEGNIDQSNLWIIVSIFTIRNVFFIY